MFEKILETILAWETAYQLTLVLVLTFWVAVVITNTLDFAKNAVKMAVVLFRGWDKTEHVVENHNFNYDGDKEGQTQD